MRGVLATPRVSRNGYLYLPSELENAVKALAGRAIPIYLEHVAADRAVGTARLIWNPEKRQVEYEGEIFDKDVETKIRAGAIRHVSLGADYERIDSFDSVQVPRGLAFRELSLVAVPGIPEANITVIESAELVVDGDITLHEAVGGELDWPIASEDRAWDADAAVARIRRWASRDGSGEKETIDWRKYAKAFFYYDEDHKEDFSAYKLPFADIIDGRPHIIPRAVIAVAAALQGARGGVDIPREDAEKIKARVDKLYRRIFNRPAPWNVEKVAEGRVEETALVDNLAKNMIESAEN
ncbi:MAG: hypothetical protein RMJ75_07355, partial [Nitrososphaerota archaeon]|nr:hypothetical protein [Nitrososphaerota archaeon]